MNSRLVLLLGTIFSLLTTTTVHSNTVSNDFWRSANEYSTASTWVTIGCDPTSYHNTSDTNYIVGCMLHYNDGQNSAHLGGSYNSDNHWVYAGGNTNTKVAPGDTLQYSGFGPNQQYFNSYYSGVSDSQFANMELCADTVAFPVGTSPNFTDTGVHVLKSACMHPTPPDWVTSCSVSSITINHGSLTVGEFPGASASSSGQVNCTGDATVTLTVTPSTITFSNGGKSTLSFSSGSSTSMSVSKNVPTSYTVTSRLSSNGPVKTGDFVGSATIIATVQ